MQNVKQVNDPLVVHRVERQLRIHNRFIAIFFLSVCFSTCWIDGCKWIDKIIMSKKTNKKKQKPKREIHISRGKH